MSATASLFRYVALVCAATLAGCATAPPETAPKPESGQAAAGTRHFNDVFENRYVLDYELETHYSNLDKASCYSFLTGTLTNRSNLVLSRRTTVAFKVYHGNEMLFRDFTYLRANVPPGARVQFDMVQSPLHRDGCPRYDRIEAKLNLVILKTAP